MDSAGCFIPTPPSQFIGRAASVMLSSLRQSTSLLGASSVITRRLFSASAMHEFEFTVRLSLLILMERTPSG
jgi:hypothetical protein